MSMKLRYPKVFDTSRSERGQPACMPNGRRPQSIGTVNPLKMPKKYS